MTVYIFHLDDGTLGGSLEDVIRDLHQVGMVAGALGLELNQSKCEIICDHTDTWEAMLRTAPNLCTVSPEKATLLGSPLGNAACVDKAIKKKTDALSILRDRLVHLHAHDALCLLRHALSLPKLLYIL